MMAPLRELIVRFYDELWNRWNDDAVSETLSDEFVFRGSLGRETRGLVEWRAYRDLIRAGASDFNNEVVALVCEGAAGAARLRYTGTHTGWLLDLPPTNRRFEYSGAAFFTSQRNRLTSAWVLGDVDALRRQLMPPQERA